MAKYKIGITEAGDAGIDLSWSDKMDTVDGAILVTKNITPGFRDKVATNMKKYIVHATCTGYGGTVLEPNAPTPQAQKDALMTLVGIGFPKNRVVVRVDPIIPTAKGINKALDIVEMFMEEGFSRFRISVIDMYPHVRERFLTAGLPLPYGDGFYPSKDQLSDVDAMLLEAKEFWVNLGGKPTDLRIESCAEPGLKQALPCGCISALDLALLGLDTSDVDSQGPQRPKCMCYSGKTELLRCRQQCPHQCMYCYWRRG